MEIGTSRFGTLQIKHEDALEFPAGLPGFEDCQQWVLLADREDEELAWLQSMSDPAVALPVVSPRRFVPEYALRVDRSELAPLSMLRDEDAQVLVIVSQVHDELAVNLKAPVVINVARNLGRQVVTNDDWPIQHAVAPARQTLRKIA